MNTKLSSIAIALSLVAGSSFAAGADGPVFPSLNAPAASAAALNRTQVHAEAVQVQNTHAFSFASADGSVDALAATPGAARSRDAVKAEVLDAIKVGALGHAHTPY